MYENYSVLMAVYHKDHPLYFKEAINSILRQTVKTDDFVIVCDGKLTSELDNIISSFCAQYPTLFNVIQLEKNQGLGNALNIGMQHCQNELIARMDSDDLSEPNRAELQLEFFESNQDCDALSGNVYEADAETLKIISLKTLPETFEEVKKYARFRSPLNHPCVMYKKSKVLGAGGYIELYRHEDYYLWTRMLANGCKIYNLNEILLTMRVNQDFFKRRGGMKHLKAFITLKRYQRQIRFISLSEFLISVLVNGCVMLMPDKLRETFYMKVLRKNS